MAALEPDRHRGRRPALGHIGWRTYGPGDVETIAQRVDPDLAEGWVEDSVGHGRSFRFRAPMGHLNEVFWETELYEAPPELQTDMRLRPQRYTGRGAAARYIDHVTINAPQLKDEIAWYRQTLGHRHTGSITPEPGVPMFTTLTCNAIRSTHDLALVPDAPHARGRVNHLAFRVDQKLDLERAADVFLANDTPIEFGPGIHGMDEIMYLYVREPGGLRIEVNSGGWINCDARLGRAGAPPARGPDDVLPQRADARLDDGVVPAAGSGPGALHRDRAVRRVMRALIVGGGIGGLCSAVALRRAGLDVDVVEINPDWDVYGVGIIQPGNALRALGALGLAGACLQQGYGFPGHAFHDRDGNPLGSPTDFPLPPGAPGPAMNGITRPRLHKILQDAALDSGAQVRTGLTVARLPEQGEVEFSDGTAGDYDLVIGADGINSLVRSLVFGSEVKPEYIGQVCWRYNVPRRPEVDPPADVRRLAREGGLRAAQRRAHVPADDREAA